MLYQPCLQAKESSRETILIPSLRQNILPPPPPLKSLPCYKIGSRANDSWYYVEKFLRQSVGYHCYQKLRQTNFFKKNLGKCSQIGCFKVRNLTRKTLILRQSPSNNILQNMSFTGEIAGSLTHQSPRGIMGKLFGCIRTPAKRLLSFSNIS